MVIRVEMDQYEMIATMKIQITNVKIKNNCISVEEL